MASGTPTTNLGLRTMTDADSVDAQDINYNSGVLDTKIGAVGSTSLQSQINATNSKFITIESGSLHDINKTGIYYLKNAVTDKPDSNGGYYSLSCYDNNTMSGIFVSTVGKKTYLVSKSGGIWAYEELAINSDVNTLTGTGTYLTSYEIKYTKVGHVCTFSVTFVPNTDIASSTGMTYIALPIPASSVVNIYPVSKDNESFNTADVQNRFAGIVRDGQATRFKAVGNYTSGTSYSFSGSYVTAN